MRTSFAFGRYQGAETDLLLEPQFDPGPQRYGALLAGGYGQPTLAAFSEQSTISTFWPIGARLRAFYAEYGNVVGFGNDAMVARMETARIWHDANRGVKGGKKLLVGISMGTILCLRYAMANPQRVAAIALCLPVPDIQYMWDNNLGGFQAALTTAYGARPTNPQTPARNSAAFQGIPMAIWGADNDPLCPMKEVVTPFVTATGAQFTTLGSVGHLSSDPQGLTDFLGRYAV